MSISPSAPSEDTPASTGHSRGNAPGWVGKTAAIVARPKVTWLLLVLWVVLVGVTGPLQPQLQESTTNESSKFLPASAESTRATQLLADPALAGADAVPAILIAQSDDMDALTQSQRAAIADLMPALQDAATAAADATLQSPFAAGSSEFIPGAQERGLVSEDMSTLVITAALESPDSDVIAETVSNLRETIDEELSAEGVTIFVSGPAGISADAIEVFAAIDVTLLLGTSVLVLVLLLVIYRSPVIAFIPLVAAFAAYAAAAGVLYLLIDPLDLIVSGQTTGIMTVLIFGATTDYCLLIVARYREELERYESRHTAMAQAVSRTTPAILSSGGTVIAAMFVLLFADLQSTSSLGPALIVGVAMAMVSGLTLLPALLLVVGRRAFWPSIPAYGDSRTQQSRLWGSLASAIERRPRHWAIGTFAILIILTAGFFTQDNGRLSDLDFFVGSVESIEGLEALGRTLPSGALAPSSAVISGDDQAEVEQTAERLTGVLNTDNRVASARPAGGGVTESGTALSVVQFTTAGNPYEDEALETIPDLRDTVQQVEGPGTEVLIGGPTAEQYDISAANERDLRIIVPGVLASIFIVLIMLLRALLAPLLLLGTVILSFAATLGLVWVVFIGILGQPGIDPGTITFIFLFTSALGIDYNIFLVARIREEAAVSGTRGGTTTALRTTGGVITSAGVILAGTFLILAALPLLPLQQLGIAVAAGVLIDTVLVRGMLVPASMQLLGRRAWWPSSDSR